MMLYGLIILFERTVTVTEVAVTTSFTCLVSNLLCNVQAFLTMLYGLVILFEGIVTVTEVAVTTILLQPCPQSVFAIFRLLS